ncbi:MAG: chloride channel protein [Bdellovibrio sp.]|nr:chloride channel protein [Bdellovibrio sp.]
MIDQTPKEITVTLILGLLIGLLIFLFFKTLRWIELQHLIWNEMQIPYHLIALPAVLFLLFEIKKRTLYFPSKVSEVTKSHIELVQHWSPAMSFFHFIGTSLSHLVGASVGREGTVILMSAGLVRLFKLSWNFWGPIALTIGFSAVVGQPLVSVIFIMEVFSTSIKQKIYAFIGAMTASLLMQTLKTPHLFESFQIQSNFSFFQKFFFVLFTGVLAGYMMRVYKKGYFYLSDYFQRHSVLVKISTASALAIFLGLPGIRKFQGLGILQLENIQNLAAQPSDVVIKLFVTLLSVTLGFWGGEFIPLVYAGLHFGNVISQFFQFDLILGSMLCAYLFFAGATRLKWTTLVLTILLVGWGWWFWAYVLVFSCVHFSGPESIYKSHN